MLTSTRLVGAMAVDVTAAGNTRANGALCTAAGTLDTAHTQHNTLSFTMSNTTPQTRTPTHTARPTTGRAVKCQTCDLKVERSSL